MPCAKLPRTLSLSRWAVAPLGFPVFTGQSSSKAGYQVRAAEGIKTFLYPQSTSSFIFPPRRNFLMWWVGGWVGGWVGQPNPKKRIAPPPPPIPPPQYH